jgi:GTP cyclohydrolase I
LHVSIDRDDDEILDGDVASADYASLVRRQLELLGEDPEREGLRRTPERVAQAMGFLTAGYQMTLDQVVGSALFAEEHEQMVMVRDIELYSLCEHHLLPFFGKAHVAYIPNGRVVGLSKLPRLVDMFARRLQVQERLTEQVATAIETVLAPRGVGVVIEAFHMCMMMRGVEKQNSRTITSALRGGFRDDAKTRDEFLRLAYASRAVADGHRVPGRRLATLLASMTALAVELGCASRPATREVVIRSFAFSPATDTVQTGDTVRWINQDVVPHTATSRIGGFDTGTLEAGQDWRYVARKPGTFAYECTLHSTMRGTLVVR